MSGFPNTEAHPALTLRPCSSLAKIFPDEAPSGPVFQGASLLRGAHLAFQLGCYWEGGHPQPARVELTTDAESLSSISIRQVGLVPSRLPIFPESRGAVLRRMPGLFPDPLLPITEDFRLLPRQWSSLWVDVEGGTLPLGLHSLCISLFGPEGALLGRVSVWVEQLETALPPQRLEYTNWFHNDALCHWYRVDFGSEDYWRIAENYMRMAAEHGMTMALTPTFTPALDTEIGAERLTTQLVEVHKEGEQYRFDFTLLARWVAMCRRVGIRSFEMAHCFTQWGAAAAPKVMGWENGSYRRLFGWETPATSPEYRNFLHQYFSALKPFLEEQDLCGCTRFHVSDEPNMGCLDNYRYGSELLHAELPGYPVMDALSNFDYYEQGLCQHPVPATNHILPFLEAGVPDLWTYYCVGQHDQVVNRFHAFPSARSRMLGLQLYKFRIAGFLQWGYNFYGSQRSHDQINPFACTDADGSFPSGDAFVVYPGPDGMPIPSLTLRVLREAFEDIRALQALEAREGWSHEAVVAWMEASLPAGLPTPISFTEYPVDEAWLLGLREKLNRLLG